MLIDIYDFVSANMNYPPSGYFLLIGNYNADLKINKFIGKIIIRYKKIYLIIIYYDSIIRFALFLNKI